MKKKFFSVTFWLIVFFSIVAVEGYLAFARDADIIRIRANGGVRPAPILKPGERRDQVEQGQHILVQILAERQLRVRRLHGDDRIFRSKQADRFLLRFLPAPKLCRRDEIFPFECPIERRFRAVPDVHRDLGDAVLRGQ